METYTQLTQNKDITREQRLWGAVLVQAIEDTTAPRASFYCGNTPKARAARIDQMVTAARNWFKHEDMHVGGFGWICEQLDIRPVDVRKMIKQ